MLPLLMVLKAMVPRFLRETFLDHHPDQNLSFLKRYASKFSKVDVLTRERKGKVFSLFATGQLSLLSFVLIGLIS